MSKDLEQRALISVLSSPLADCLPYFRSTYYLELFPKSSVGMQWIVDYTDKSGDLPSLKEFKRKYPKLVPKRPQKPEPLVIVLDELKQDLVEDVASQSAEDMNDAFAKRDMVKFASLGEEMTDKLTLINAPIEAQLLDVDTHTEQVLAEIKAGRGAGRVIPTGFEPLDKEIGGGWGGGRLYTLSALIHLGKTYATVASATHAKKLGFKVLYVSLEMSGADISEMSLCLEHKLNVNEYIKREQPQNSIDRKESKDDWLKRILEDRLKIEKPSRRDGKLYIQGNEMGLNCAKNIRALAKEKDVDIVFIDAAQDIQANKQTTNRVSNLYVALTELNSVSVSLGIPVVMTVQLSAEVEKKGLTNNLTNIQWGQVFAQKSHAVISMLGDRTATVRDCTIEKNRAGVCGTKFEMHMIFPEVEVFAKYLSASGLLLTEEDIFEDADDISRIQNMGSEEPGTKKPLRVGRSLRKRGVEPKEDPEEEPEAVPKKQQEDSDYQRRSEEKATIRKARSLKRKKSK